MAAGQGECAADVAREGRRRYLATGVELLFLRLWWNVRLSTSG